MKALEKHMQTAVSSFCGRVIIYTTFLGQRFRWSVTCSIQGPALGAASELRRRQVRNPSVPGPKSSAARAATKTLPRGAQRRHGCSYPWPIPAAQDSIGSREVKRQDVTHIAYPSTTYYTTA